MNWVFWILVFLAVVCIWFGLTILFKPIGSIFEKIWKDTVDTIKNEESED